MNMSTLGLIELTCAALDEIDRRDRSEDGRGPNLDEDKGAVDISLGQFQRTEEGWFFVWHTEAGIDTARTEYPESECCKTGQHG